jgi:hypothetical protein
MGGRGSRRAVCDTNDNATLHAARCLFEETWYFAQWTRRFELESVLQSARREPRPPSVFDAASSLVLM